MVNSLKMSICGTSYRSLRESKEFVGLQAESPLRMRKAVTNGELRVAPTFRSVHRLKKEVPKLKRLEVLGRRALLGKNKLQLVTVPKAKTATHLGAHADPI